MIVSVTQPASKVLLYPMSCEQIAAVPSSGRSRCGAQGPVGEMREARNLRRYPWGRRGASALDYPLAFLGSVGHIAPCGHQEKETHETL